MKHVAVLYGGLSSERDVSLRSGAAVADALKAAGYQVTLLDVQLDVADRLKALAPDVAFIALHGTYGEDGCIQGLLEFLRIPYTHSGVEASAVAMNKELTRVLAKVAGVSVAEGGLCTAEQLLAGKVPAPYPCVIKPAADGSSVDVFVIHSAKELAAIAEKLKRRESWLVEQFIAGLELSVAVLDGKALGVVEIAPKDGFYDYTNKYTAGKTEYFIPARIDAAMLQRVQRDAEMMHAIIGCRGVSRSDFRYDRDGSGACCFLEINTHPGMTATSLTPKMAAYAGLDFQALVTRLVESAMLDKSPK